MSKGLTKEEVEKITPQEVHKVLNRVLLTDGFPLVFDFDKSEGSYLYDSRTNKKFLDFFTFFASWAVGYNHPKMNDPKFLEHLGKVAAVKIANSDIYTVEMAQFVATFERVCMPKEFKRVFFIDGGALAVENALKVAFDWKTRKNFANGKEKEAGSVIHFRQSFHGRSGYTMSLTNTDPWKVRYFPKFDWPRIDNPVCHFPLEGDNLKKVIEAEEKALNQIKDAISKDADGIACLIIEPIQGEGGDNHFRKEFMQELRKITEEHDILFICDEVQSGMGITGKMWAYEHYDIVPDIVSFGKKSQVCGIMVTERCLKVESNVFVQSSRINSTWGGNIADMLRAQRIYEIIEEEKLVDNAAEVGAYLLQKLLELQTAYPSHISNTRGKGLFCSFDLPSKEFRDSLKAKCYEKSMIILPCGPSSLRFRPALNSKKAHVDEAYNILNESLKELVK
ncbi:aminotransferase [Anaeramoeba ignava]|uniref:L-lysine-epsilon aminotransferase n=1 Tax=Anaeramoeba ignava TaxID=1746090 RepID=A0A9Q0LK91_ANAIG|nr:aminotransferase [Anaeramoeba ignava]